MALFVTDRTDGLVAVSDCMVWLGLRAPNIFSMGIWETPSNVMQHVADERNRLICC